MSVIENREVKKRLNYLQSQLDLVDSACWHATNFTR